MEESIKEMIVERFQLPKVDIKTYSSLALAYIGDGIFDLVIRTIVVGQGNTSANRLHIQTSKIVKAASQAAMMEELMTELTEEELEVYRRGRNAKSHSIAKNASVMDYRNATGFEALMGYLYLTNQMERMMDLVEIGLNELKG